MVVLMYPLPPTYVLVPAYTHTWKDTHTAKTVCSNILLHQFYKWILPLLCSSVILHLVEWPPQYLPYSQDLFLNASQSNRLFCQQLLGNDLFSPWKHGLQGCRFRSQSTYDIFPTHCIVLTKGLLYSVRMRHNYISFILCIGNSRVN